MREILNINKDWRFIKENNSKAYLKEVDDTTWESINIPHTWNAVDGTIGGNYFKGSCWYRKKLYIDKMYENKKIYIEFGAVNSIAEIYINGKYIGNHRGGYSIFRYNITSEVEFGKINTIAVKVDNTILDDVYPIYADFTFYGGIYRDVNIIVVEDIHFNLEVNGSKGVYIYQNKVTDNQANITIKSKISNYSDKKEDMRVCVEIIEASGEIVKYKSRDITLNSNCKGEISLVIDLDNPILWDGIRNPYLYKARITLVKDNDVMDCLEIPVGLRYFSFDAKEGFFLNGKHMKIQGVARHQDKKERGFALLKEDHLEDMGLIKEIGANSIRLAHYQHDQYFYDLCDKEGMLVWAEIPFISRASENDIKGTNAKEQLTELIHQNFNHSSIIMWGVQNEIQIGGDKPEVREIVKELNELAHKEDPTRITTQAHLGVVKPKDEYNSYTDIVGYNLYFGWYMGKAEDLAEWLDYFHLQRPETCLGISEYGAEGIIKYHSDNPEIKDYTEEYHAMCHEKHLKIFKERQFLWGSYIWNFFDFASYRRDEGGIKGRNNKGLVTFDRKIKKDAFYLYKANWSKELFVNIASKRFIDRDTELINIKVYSNCDEVILYVNGKNINRISSKYIFEFKDVELRDGDNDIVVVANKDGKTFRDYAYFNKVKNSNTIYSCPKQKDSSIINWFNKEPFGDLESIDIVKVEISKNVFSTATAIKEILENQRAKEIFSKYFSKLLEDPRVNLMKEMSLDEIAKMMPTIFNDKVMFILNRELTKIEK